MKEMTERLADDAELAAAYAGAHEHYLAQRAELGDVPEIDGISAGGMPTRVKCLHVLVGALPRAPVPASTRSATRRSRMLDDWWGRVGVPCARPRTPARSDAE